jgi:hypothetical protein
MNIKEYLKSKITPGKQPDLTLIYEELMNLGHEPVKIYELINEQIKENIKTVIEDYNKRKNENK